MQFGAHESECCGMCCADSYASCVRVVANAPANRRPGSASLAAAGYTLQGESHKGYALTDAGSSCLCLALTVAPFATLLGFLCWFVFARLFLWSSGDGGGAAAAAAAQAW